MKHKNCEKFKDLVEVIGFCGIIILLSSFLIISMSLLKIAIDQWDAVIMMIAIFVTIGSFYIIGRHFYLVSIKKDTVVNVVLNFSGVLLLLISLLMAFYPVKIALYVTMGFFCGAFFIRVQRILYKDSKVFSNEA